MTKNVFVHAVSWLLIVQAHAFTLSTCTSVVHRQSCSVSETELYGLRTFLKKKLSRSQRPTSDESSSSPTTIVDLPLLHENRNDHAYSDEFLMEADKSLSMTSFTSSSTVSLDFRPITTGRSLVDHPAEVVAKERSTADTITLKRVAEEHWLDRPYVLPPIGDRQLTKLEQEFREMLIHFSKYTQRDIMAVRDRRMRVIFQGVAASFGLPEVYRAFEILFEDYSPLRIAGRLIYGKLKTVMDEAQLERQREVDTVAEMTGLSREEIEASRSAYFQLVVHEDDAATEMTIQQIVDYGLAEMAVELLGFESFEDFVASLNPCEKQKVDFGRLMVGLQSCPIDNPSPECNPATVLLVIARKLGSRDAPARSDNKDQKKMRLNERYNMMVEQFREWKSLVSNGDGRRLEVLRGCFVGAESKDIVEALRVVYLDYSALRMSGDLIFKVMAALVGRKS